MSHYDDVQLLYELPALDVFLNITLSVNYFTTNLFLHQQIFDRTFFV